MLTADWNGLLMNLEAKGGDIWSMTGRRKRRKRNVDENVPRQMESQPSLSSTLLSGPSHWLLMWWITSTLTREQSVHVCNQPTDSVLPGGTNWHLLISNNSLSYNFQLLLISSFLFFILRSTNLKRSNMTPVLPHCAILGYFLNIEWGQNVNNLNVEQQQPKQ